MADQATHTRPAKPEKPRVWQVKWNLPATAVHNTRVVPPFDTENAARRYVENNHPRGHEVYLETPEGTKHHYAADEDEPWQTHEDEE
jgi:hypothetical protein